MRYQCFIQLEFCKTCNLDYLLKKCMNIIISAQWLLHPTTDRHLMALMHVLQPKVHCLGRHWWLPWVALNCQLDPAITPSW